MIEDNNLIKLIQADLKKVMKNLNDLSGVSGYEDEVASYVYQQANQYTNDLKIDNFGNVITKIAGDKKKKIMITAHLDEIGLIIRYIDKNGFIYAEKIGGVRTQNLFSRPCFVKTRNGLIKGLINSINPGRPKEMKYIPEVNEFFIDVGVDSKAEVDNLGIEIGNTISIDYSFDIIGNKIIGKALDDRLQVFILLETMKIIKKYHKGRDIPTIYSVFTTQEEVGCRGAKVAAYSLDPDLAIALDITVANDTPQIPEFERISTLGKGPAIKVMDRIPNGVGMISSSKIVEKLKSISKENNIKYQLEVFTAGSTDGATIHLERGGIPTGAILTPTRYVHAYEMAAIDDVITSIELLYRFIESID